MFESENGSRTIVTESNAMARKVSSSVRIKGLSSSRTTIVVVNGLLHCTTTRRNQDHIDALITFNHGVINYWHNESLDSLSRSELKRTRSTRIVTRLCRASVASGVVDCRRLRRIATARDAHSHTARILINNVTRSAELRADCRQ